MTTIEQTAPWALSTLDGLQLPVPPDWTPAFNDEAGWRVLLDEDFFTWLTDDATDKVLKKRAYFCLRELLVNGRCGRVKTVRGAGKGWLRTPLGGSGGSHYYLWWAPYGTPAVQDAGLAERDILVRAVRHHDETGSALSTGNPNRHELSLEEVVHTSGDSPFTDEQMSVATSGEAPVKLVRGAPGSGKTTALWLSGSYATGAKAIYLTYSRGLARTAEDYFRAFGPEGTPIDVLTFEDLLVELADAHPGAIDFMAPTSGAERLREALADFHQPLGAWKDRIDELYAELHAHSVGRALPIAFRDLGATSDPILSTAGYVKTRSKIIGDAAARTADQVARNLHDRDLITTLFPGPVHARSLLRGHDAPPPPRFDGVSSIFVDEIQDLTPVEAMLVLSLAARIGVALGTMPSLLIAGDEAQTVRPTDFRWAWLGDLIETVLGPRLGKRSEHALSTNLRSPRLIASVIENSKKQYQRFEKDQRPSGLTYVESDETAVSRVVYCRAPSDADWARVTEFFAGSPSSQLVYPGYRVPDDIAPRDEDATEDALSVDIATSDQVKGLDYPLVGVIDAGRGERKLLDLADQADASPIVSLWGRTLADQFRVAVSRTTETLVLLDRGPEDFTSTVHDLCGPVASEVLEELDPDGLFELLDEDIEPADLLAAQLDEVRRILDNDPERALGRVRSAHRILERARVADEGIEALVADTQRLYGVVAAVAVIRRGNELDAATRKRYQAEAVRWLGESGFGPLYDVVRSVGTSVLDQPVARKTVEAVRAAAPQYAEIARRLPELEEPVRTTLVRWARIIPDAQLPADDDAADAVLAALGELVDVLEGRHPELIGERDECIRAQATKAADGGQYERALALHRRVTPTDPAFETRCLEALLRWEEAAGIHEASGQLTEALRCVREIPDFEWAVRLADDPDVGQRMQWALDLLESTDHSDLAIGAPLTDAERSALEAHLSAALDQARSSVPGPRPVPAPPEPTESLPDEVAVENTSTSEPERSPEQDKATSDDPEAETPAGRKRQATITVSQLAAELQMSATECLALCAKLGVRAASEDSSIPEFMAARVRNRAQREAGDSGQPSTEEAMDADLLERLLAVIQAGDEVKTIAAGKPNLIVELDARGARIQTKRSAAKGDAKFVPAWMFNEAWRTLQRDGSLANTDLVKTVKRSSAVLAILEQIPEVGIESANPTVLRMVDDD